MPEPNVQQMFGSEATVNETQVSFNASQLSQFMPNTPGPETLIYAILDRAVTFQDTDVTSQMRITKVPASISNTPNGRRYLQQFTVVFSVPLPDISLQSLQ